MEYFFNKIKAFRQIATCYDKLATYFLAFVYVTSICSLNNTTLMRFQIRSNYKNSHVIKTNEAVALLQAYRYNNFVCYKICQLKTLLISTFYIHFVNYRLFFITITN